MRFAASKTLIESIDLAGTFLVYGIAFASLVLLGATWMRYPAEGWLPDGFEPEVGEATGAVDFTPREMLRTPQFHLISLTFAVSAGAGLMAIGLMKLYPVEALVDNGITLDSADAIAGTAMAVFFSLANGMRRACARPWRSPDPRWRTCPDRRSWTRRHPCGHPEPGPP